MEPLLALRSINFLASSSGLLKTSLYFIRCVSGTWKNIFDLQRHKPTHIHSSVKTAEINKRRRKTAFGEIFTPPATLSSLLCFVTRVRASYTRIKTSHCWLWLHTEQASVSHVEVLCVTRCALNLTRRPGLSQIFTSLTTIRNLWHYHNIYRKFKVINISFIDPVELGCNYFFALSVRQQTILTKSAHIAFICAAVQSVDMLE